MSRPHGRLAFASGWRVGRGRGRPHIRRAFPARSRVGEGNHRGILAAPNDHLIGSVDACKYRRVRRARSGRIHGRDRGPTVGEDRWHDH